MLPAASQAAIKDMNCHTNMHMMQITSEVMGYVKTAHSPYTLDVAGLRAWVETDDDGTSRLVAQLVMERAKESLYHAIK